MVGCSTGDPFQALSLAFAKDYPLTATALEQARTNNDQADLELYEAVQRGREQLFQRGQHAALEEALDVASRSCNSTEWARTRTQEDRCRGAAVALWYFTSEAEDARIRQQFAAHPAALEAMAQTCGATPLLYNRPSPAPWNWF